MNVKEALKSVFTFILIVALLLTLCIVLYLSASSENEATVPTNGEAYRTVVLDAGHGGIDGGAVADDGTLEKDINLQITKILSSLMRISGYKVVTTRDGDVMLDTDDGRGNAKMRDLKKRLEIASAYPDALAVSIHCNKFPQESCKGLQVYHSDSEKAEASALAIQEAFLLISPENHRKIKKADSSIYLLHRAKTPTVLVECGFLSNHEELARLKTTEYKKELALVIFKGIDASMQAQD